MKIFANRLFALAMVLLLVGCVTTEPTTGPAREPITLAMRDLSVPQGVDERKLISTRYGFSLYNSVSDGSVWYMGCNRGQAEKRSTMFLRVCRVENQGENPNASRGPDTVALSVFFIDVGGPGATLDALFDYTETWHRGPSTGRLVKEEVIPLRVRDMTIKVVRRTVRLSLNTTVAYQEVRQLVYAAVPFGEHTIYISGMVNPRNWHGGAKWLDTSTKVDAVDVLADLEKVVVRMIPYHSVQVAQK